MALTTHLHLAPRLKKEWSYTSIPPLGLHSRLQGLLDLAQLENINKNKEKKDKKEGYREKRRTIVENDETIEKSF